MTGTPWRCAGFGKCFQTSQSAVICESARSSFNLFVFNLLKLIADVRAPPEYLDGYNQRWTVTKYLCCTWVCGVFEASDFHSTTFQSQIFYFWWRLRLLATFKLEASKPAVSRSAITIVFFCFIELFLLKAVQFSAGQCINIVMTHYSHSTRAGRHTEIMMWD